MRKVGSLGRFLMAGKPACGVPRCPRAVKTASRKLFRNRTASRGRSAAYGFVASRENAHAYGKPRQDRQSLQTDPVGYAADLNIYTYVANDPLNITDSSGADYRGGCIEFGGGGSRVCVPGLQSENGGTGADGEIVISGGRAGVTYFTGNSCTFTCALFGGPVEFNVGGGPEFYHYESARDIGLPGAAATASAAAIGSAGPLADVAVPTIAPITRHGAERIAGANATRGSVLSGGEILMARIFGQRLVASNGARVYVQRVAGGRFNVAIFGDRGFMTSYKGLSSRSLNNLGARFGWRG